jgi:hypothetical protein
MEGKTLSRKASAETITLMLITEELKNRKLFDDLRWLGYYHVFYRSDLIEIIMLSIGLNPEVSLQRSFCHTLLDRHSQRIVESRRELMDEAKRVYDQLSRHAAVCRRQSTMDSPASTVKSTIL